MEQSTRNDNDDDHFESLLSPREALSNRLYCPQPKLDLLLSKNRDTINNESTLSFLPWRIQYETLIAADDSLLTKGDGVVSTSIITQSFPSISYLDLRRQQNIEFSNDKCREANVLLSGSIDVAIDLKKAKTFFIQALELVPDHLQSLIGYAKLLMKTETFYKAEKILKSALEVDPNNSEIQHYLTTLQDKRRRPPLLQSEHQESKRLVFAQKQKDLVTKKSSAYQDALMERALLDPQNGKNDDDDDDDDNDECESRHRSPNRSKKKKKDKKHRHKRKRSHRKRKSKEKKHRKLRNRRYDAYSSSSYSCSSSLLSSSSSEIPIDSENEEELKTKKDSLHGDSPLKESNLLEPTFSPSSTKRLLSKSVDSEKDEDDESYRRHKKRRKHKYLSDTKRRHKRKKHSKKSHKNYSRKISEY